MTLSRRAVACQRRPHPVVMVGRRYIQASRSEKVTVPEPNRTAVARRPWRTEHAHAASSAASQSRRYEPRRTDYLVRYQRASAPLLLVGASLLMEECGDQVGFRRNDCPTTDFREVPSEVLVALKDIGTLVRC